MTERSAREVYFFTFLLAFCSLFYELVYAQVLSVCLGGTKNQYLTIISIFTCALGFGSLAETRLRARFPLRQTFFRVEVLLTLLGSAGPFLITWLLQSGPASSLVTLKVLLCYLIVFIIGFLSGFEIPCLFALRKDAQGKILAFDYAGMLVASSSFPFFFLPQFGTAASTLLVAGSNLFALVWLRSDRPVMKVSVVLYALGFFYLGVVAVYREELNGTLSRLYLGGP